MYNWFECKVKYDKTINEESKEKNNKPEVYLVDALTFTEAEKRIMMELRPYNRGEITIDSIKHVKIHEIFDQEQFEDYRFYKIKVNTILVDESKGKEKTVSLWALVKATSIQQALQIHEKGMQGTVADYTIVSIAETPIYDVFHYLVPVEKD